MWPFRFEWGGQILANPVRFHVTGPAPRREPVAARPSEASPRTRFPKGSAVDVNGRTVSCAAISSDPRRTTARERPAPDGEPSSPWLPGAVPYSTPRPTPLRLADHLHRTCLSPLKPEEPHNPSVHEIGGTPRWSPHRSVRSHVPHLSEGSALRGTEGFGSVDARVLARAT